MLKLKDKKEHTQNSFDHKFSISTTMDNNRKYQIEKAIFKNRFFKFLTSLLNEKNLRHTLETCYAK